MLAGILFLWKSTRGYRFTPWRSPYIRWRVETYTGMKAEEVNLQRVLQLVWVERFQLVRFMSWLRSLRSLGLDSAAFSS